MKEWSKGASCTNLLQRTPSAVGAGGGVKKRQISGPSLSSKLWSTFDYNQYLVVLMESLLSARLLPGDLLRTFVSERWPYRCRNLFIDSAIQRTHHTISVLRITLKDLSESMMSCLPGSTLFPSVCETCHLSLSWLWNPPQRLCPC